eukprot:14608819-Alexandrium_andersonii.AAC.1
MGLLVGADKKTIGQAFRPHQFAVGVPSGAEALAKAARTLAGTEGFGPDPGGHRRACGGQARRQVSLQLAGPRRRLGPAEP